MVFIFLSFSDPLFIVLFALFDTNMRQNNYTLMSMLLSWLIIMFRATVDGNVGKVGNIGNVDVITDVSVNF